MLCTKKHGGPKNVARFCIRLITSSDIDQFSNFVYCQNQENICNNTIIKDPTTPQMYIYTNYLVKCHCLKSNNWKQAYYFWAGSLYYYKFFMILTVNKIENRSVFDEVKAYKNVLIFGATM